MKSPGNIFNVDGKTATAAVSAFNTPSVLLLRISHPGRKYKHHWRRNMNNMHSFISIQSGPSCDTLRAIHARSFEDM